MDHAISHNTNGEIRETSRSAHVAYMALLQRLLSRAPRLGYDSVSSLPHLDHGDLQIVLRHRPELFHEALSDGPGIGRLVTKFLTEPMGSQFVGQAVITAIWSHVRPLLLVDLQEERERQLGEHSVHAAAIRYEAVS